MYDGPKPYWETDEKKKRYKLGSKKGTVSLRAVACARRAMGYSHSPYHCATSQAFCAQGIWLEVVAGNRLYIPQCSLADHPLPLAPAAWPPSFLPRKQQRQRNMPHLTSRGLNKLFRETRQLEWLRNEEPAQMVQFALWFSGHPGLSKALRQDNALLISLTQQKWAFTSSKSSM